MVLKGLTIVSDNNKCNSLLPASATAMLLPQLSDNDAANPRPSGERVHRSLVCVAIAANRFVDGAGGRVATPVRCGGFVDGANAVASCDGAQLSLS